MNKTLWYCGLILLFALSKNISSAQLPTNPIGQNPLSIQWKEINTDKVQVIFPSELDSAGLRIANLIHRYYTSSMPQVTDQNKKIPILIHAQNVRSNGFVIVGPFRSEWYTQPPMFHHNTHWTDHLTIHEYRHVQQLANADKGLTAAVGNIFGSWLYGGMSVLALPRWYLEGDAVIAETGMTNAGRGRFSEFNQEYHALFLADKNYNYEKAAAGSLSDFVPNWYPLGYNMMAYAREKYGANLWQEVADDAVRYKGLVYPFAKSLKKKTGLSPKALYDETMDDLRTKWAVVNENINFEGLQVNIEKKPTVIHYNASQAIGNDKIAFIKSGYNQLNELVVMDKGGKETKLTTIGRLIDRQMSTLDYHDGKLIWSELGFHPRWSNETYTEIFYYDMTEGVKKKLTDNTRYHAPVFSPSGKEVAAVHIGKDLVPELHILSFPSGDLLKKHRGSYLDTYTYPTWTSDKDIAFINIRDQKSHLWTFNTETLNIETIKDYGYQNITHLTYDGGQIYYAKSYNYKQQIFSLNLETLEESQYSDDPISAFQPTLSDDGKILYSALRADGYNLIQANQKPKRVTDRASSIPPEGFYVEEMTIQEGGNVLDEVTSEDIQIKNFNRFSGLFNFHSLIPEWTPPEVSLSLLSDNVFGTLSASLVGEYNYNEEAFSYGINMRYAELYPILDLDYRRANRSALFYNFRPDTDTSFYQDVFIESWDENRLTTGFTLPYNFSKGAMFNRMSLTARYQNIQVRLPETSEKIFVAQDTIATNARTVNAISEVFDTPIENGSIHALDLFFSFQMLRLQALQHLRSRLGISLSGRVRQNIGGSLDGGNSSWIRGFLFLPGISKNHSFSIEAMFMQEGILDKYRFGDGFSYPRGYDFSLRRDQFFKLGFNYRFPIAYPDLALGGWAFLKRLKANVFYDYGSFGTTSFPFETRYQNVSSVGLELGIDFRALRLVEVDMGIRYSYLLNQQFAPDGQQHVIDFFVISVTE